MPGEMAGDEKGQVRALTVRQPWAWLLFHGKPVENRDWWTSYRGPLAIHAAKGMTRMEYEDAFDFVSTFAPQVAATIPPREGLVRGAVIGTVEMVACADRHSSPFFQGKYGFVFENQKLLSVPIPAAGALGLWNWSGLQ